MHADTGVNSIGVHRRLILFRDLFQDTLRQLRYYVDPGIYYFGDVVAQWRSLTPSRFRRVSTVIGRANAQSASPYLQPEPHSLTVVAQNHKGVGFGLQIGTGRLRSFPGCPIP